MNSLNKRDKTGGTKRDAARSSKTIRHKSRPSRRAPDTILGLNTEFAFVRRFLFCSLLTHVACRRERAFFPLPNRRRHAPRLTSLILRFHFPLLQFIVDIPRLVTSSNFRFFARNKRHSLTLQLCNHCSTCAPILVMQSSPQIQFQHSKFVYNFFSIRFFFISVIKLHF